MTEAAARIAFVGFELSRSVSEQTLTLETTSVSSAEVSSSANPMAKKTREAVGFMDGVGKKVVRANESLEKLTSSFRYDWRHL